MELKDIIINEIKNNGAIPFHQFMEMALYYPQKGYYTSSQKKFGERGDYYTSPVISELYGILLARQLEEMWFLLGREPFTIVEYGAGEGALAARILKSLQKNERLYNQLSYIIIEKSESLREYQHTILPEKVRWIQDIEEIKGFNGVVISNEVLDNFSVHEVVKTDELYEVFVNYDTGFKEELKPAPNVLKAFLNKMEVTLPANYRTEICLEVEPWIESIAKSMNRGFVITVDYGYSNDEYFSQKRSAGTLACYYKHTVSDKYYENVGKQDITAHVNFSALNYFAKEHGFEFAGYCNQNYFLRSLGLAGVLRNLEETHQNVPDWNAVQKLIMDMGHKFKVLVHNKDVKARFLTGLQFVEKEP